MKEVLFINPGNAKSIYQNLANEYSAIETPTWSLLLAESCRSIGHDVAILDINAERISLSAAAKKIKLINPKLICFVVYGQNVNAGTTNMSGAVLLSEYLKSNNFIQPIVYIGSHVQSLPLETLKKEKSIDIVLTNEGVYSIRNLLKLKEYDYKNLKKVKGIGFRSNNKVFLNSPEKIVPQDRMDIDLPGYAWDLLPFKKKPFDKC